MSRIYNELHTNNIYLDDYINDEERTNIIIKKEKYSKYIGYNINVVYLILRICNPCFEIITIEMNVSFQELKLVCNTVNSIIIYYDGETHNILKIV